MTFSVYLLALVVLVLGLTYTWRRKRVRNMPPGPKPLPFIGNLHQVKGSLHETYIELSKKYGDIFTMHMGSYKAVILNNPKLIKEALNEAVFSSRRTGLPRGKDRQKGGNWGIMFADDQTWLEQRRFTIKTLKEFGFGKRSVEPLLLQEVNELIEGFKKSDGKPIQTQDRFNVAVLNSLWQMVTGKRYSHSDSTLQYILGALSSQLKGSAITTLAMYSHIIYYFVILLPRKYLGKDFFAGRHRIMDLIKREIKEHQDTLQPDATPRDFIDVYLVEMQKPGAGRSFNEEDGSEKFIATLLKDTYSKERSTSSSFVSTMSFQASFPQI